jgi:two-component system chemotaxis response regulator CheB
MNVQIVVTDDSDIAAAYVQRVLEIAPDMKVIDTPHTADELLQSESLRRADVVVLDLWMPGRVGLGVVKQLSRSVPVIVVSDVDPQSPMAAEALAQGALAFISKRELKTDEGGQRLRLAARNAAKQPVRFDQPLVIVVGSTGAMPGFKAFVPEVRGGDASFLFVQHMPEGREESFSEWISSMGLPTRPAMHGDPLRVGRGLVAPSGRHMIVAEDGRHVALRDGEPVEGHRPSGTVLLQSAAPLGSRLIAVIFSGMGGEGSEAVPQIIEHGGKCLVQAPEDCVVPSMPSAALAKSPSVRSVPLSELGVRTRMLIRRQGSG